jgi:hypothetical protein
MKSFRTIGWVAGVGGAALCCYMLSLQVAAERADLTRLKAQIVETERSIRTLQTELGARGRVHQLQHWASSEFGFAPPTAEQYLDGEVRLARYEAPAEQAMDAPVRMAEAPAETPRLPPVTRAAAPAGEERPVRRAAPAPERERPAADQPRLVRAAAPAPAERPRAVRAAAGRPPLIDPGTLRDLDDRARREGGGRGR